MKSQKDAVEEHDSKVVEFERKQVVTEMFARLRKYRGRLPPNFKFNREDANERR
ncbi:hypothetical protein [Pseudoduganella violaceinigra]|uniref:hypothetical protein n=1 Tax=Pseudoduganella violaceinigra TaxID=246602 RepID=UPI000418E593|nr:hypothetical protein [Pseudoduganella violaceinigra]